MAFMTFDMTTELTKVLTGRRSKITRYALLHAIANALGLGDELKRTR